MDRCEHDRVASLCSRLEFAHDRNNLLTGGCLDGCEHEQDRVALLLIGICSRSE